VYDVQWNKDAHDVVRVGKSFRIIREKNIHKKELELYFHPSRMISSFWVHM